MASEILGDDDFVFHWKRSGIQKMLPVSHLRLDGKLVKYTDGEWVNTLVSENAPDTWEPLSVLQQSKNIYVVKDGNHRLTAAYRLGLKKLLCELLEG